MSQYGWRIGPAGAGALALVIAARGGWAAAYIVCAGLALPAMVTALAMGEPERHREPAERKGVRRTVAAAVEAVCRILRTRRGAVLVLLFILLHKIGDTLANLTFRLLFDDLHFTNDEIALYDAGVGFWAYLDWHLHRRHSLFRLGMKRSVLISLILMAVSNLGFALLAAAGHSVAGMAGAIGFEYASSGIGGVCVVAYFSALCDLRFTATQYALISAAASVVGRAADRNQRGRTDRRARLCELLSADDGARPSRDPALLGHDACWAGRRRNRKCRYERKRKPSSTRNVRWMRQRRPPD